MKHAPQGFSLIELLIVVAIILVISAIAIPNFLRSRIAANQASAVGSVRLVNTAEVAYSVTYDTGFSTTLAVLGPVPTPGGTPTSTAATMIDSVLASGAKSGYTFTYSSGPSDVSGRINAYQVTAVPLNYFMGTFTYYSDQSGVIRQNSTVTASSTDSPIGG